jgi:hypothetical protein
MPGRTRAPRQLLQTSSKYGAPKGRSTPLRVGADVPVRVQPRPAVAEVQTRHAVRAVPRTDEVQIVVVQNFREHHRVDVSRPQPVAEATFLCDRGVRDRRSDVQASTTILEADEESGYGHDRIDVTQRFGRQIILAGLAVELDATHKVVPVHLGQRSGLGRNQQEGCAVKGKPGGEPVEHVNRSQLGLGKTRPRDLEDLLGRRPGVRRREERTDIVDREVLRSCRRRHNNLSGAFGAPTESDCKARLHIIILLFYRKVKFRLIRPV